MNQEKGQVVMMKIYVALVGVFCLLVIALASPASAKGPSAVSNTLHNLSTSAPDDPYFPGQSFYRSRNEDEVCVFCHTPHGGSLRGPLWNHLDPTSSFTHYNSVTLSTYIKGLSANRTPSDETLICLSCHDGSVAVNSLHNMNNDVGQPIVDNVGPGDVMIAYMFGGGANLGDGAGNLDNDHPISFSYDAVYASDEYGPTGSKKDALHTPGSAASNGIKFFGANNRVECSSCHDPHVDYINNPQYTPFLIRTNGGSALCLACHNK